MAAVVPAHGQADTELRETLEAWRLTSPSNLPAGSGWVLEWATVRRTVWSAGELARRWAAIERFPDHPDRSTVEYHRSLSERPERLTGLVMLNHAGRWRYEERAEVPDGETVLVAAGNHRQRWLLFTGPGSSQLTIVGEGSPFPAPYNVGRYLDLAKERLLMVGWGGVGTIPTSARLLDVTTRQDVWSARWRDASFIWRAEGVLRATAPIPVVTRLIRAEGIADAEQVSTEWKFGRPGVLPELGLGWSGSVTEIRADGIEESIEVTRFGTISSAEIESAIGLPEVPPTTRLADFRKPDAAAWIPYASVERVTWTLKDGRDRYEIGSPLPSSTAAGITPASASGVLRKRWAVVLAVAVAIIGIVGGIRTWRLPSSSHK